MTNPVILFGTQSNGETLPVQVNATGRLVAEGLQGVEGPPGPEGPEGPEGPPGPGGIELPPDPYEGALLGWLNGELSWVGTPPVPIPESLFGPITAYESGTNFLEYAGDPPPGLGQGVYCYQCNEDGTHFTAGWNTSRIWSAETEGNATRAEMAFDGDIDNWSYGTGSDELAFIPDGGLPFQQLRVYCRAESGNTEGIKYTLEGQEETFIPNVNNTGQWHTIPGPGTLTKLRWTRPGSSNVTALVGAIELDGQILVNTNLSVQWRVQAPLEGAMTGSVVPDYADLTVGKYLYIPEQRVAPWVLYGNDPTSLIDHLRQTRD